MNADIALLRSRLPYYALVRAGPNSHQICTKAHQYPMALGNVWCSHDDEPPLDVEHLREILTDCVEGSRLRARDF